MSSKFLSLLAAASALLQVSAHGYVAKVEIAGKSYPGFDPNYDLWDTSLEDKIVRNIPNDGPITDIYSDALACNQGGQKGDGTATADINAGDDIKFTWNVWPADHAGPVSCYMAKCDGECSSFQASNAKWFKLNAEGHYDDGKWATDKLIANGLSWTCKVPQELKQGNYLIRHEIIAMHEVGAPQFYPSCSQLKVKGGANASPADNELVGIPGLYQDTKWPDIYAQNVDFKTPGPSVAKFAANNGAGNSDPAPAPEPEAASDDSESGGSCRAKRSDRKARNMKKRHLNRFASGHGNSI